MTKTTDKAPTYNQLTFYETEDGKTRIEVRFEQENVWLTQKLMAELFECSIENVSSHLQNVYATNEQDKEATIKEFLIVQKEGVRSVKRNVTFYSLEAIISVGYRINSARGTAFRKWATDRLKSYIFKGFAIDSERFKNGTRFDTRFFDELLEEIREIRASERMVYQKITDIYATSIDYSAHTTEAQKFFATVQNKLRFAITSHTAAEIIANRANKNKPNMGLTSWRKAPTGKILPHDVQVAKNYLSHEEIKALNHIVSMYLDHAEFQASRGKPMYMKDWAEKLDAFLKFNEQDILKDHGKVSHEVAVALAKKEYEGFRVEQDKKFESDFDKLTQKLLQKQTVKG